MQNTTNLVIIFSQSGSDVMPNENSSDEKYVQYFPFEELSLVPQMTHYHKK